MRGGRGRYGRHVDRVEVHGEACGVPFLVLINLGRKKLRLGHEYDAVHIFNCIAIIL